MAYSFVVLLIVFFQASAAGVRREQREEAKAMDDHPVNITVTQGSTAVLPCSVDPLYTEQNKEHYKVVWASPVHTAISMEDRRMINDMRMSVERPFLKDWNLHIRNVSVTDAGIYRCQINTVPIQSKTVELFVNVPPIIVDYTQPVELKRTEGELVELFCNATGVPAPIITWHRKNRYAHNGRERVGSSGEHLVIHNVTRLCADVYICIADNGVPPATTQEFIVDVNYPPEIELPNTRMGQEVGKETILECIISASPLHSSRWSRGDRIFGNSVNDKYEVNIYDHKGEPNTIVLSLRIMRVSPSDYGTYTCEAENNFGNVVRLMELIEVRPRTQPAPTTTTTTTTTTYLQIPRVSPKNIHRHGTGNRQKKPVVNSNSPSANRNDGYVGPNGSSGSNAEGQGSPYQGKFPNAGGVYEPDRGQSVSLQSHCISVLLCMTSLVCWMTRHA